MSDRPAWVTAAQDQLEAAVDELVSGENLRRLYVIARHLDERGSFEKARLVRRLIALLRGLAFDLLWGDDDDTAA
jgi:hypothetical protein